MLDSERVDLRAGESVPVNQAEQITQFVETETEFATTTNEMQSPQMLRPVDAVATCAPRRRRHDAIFSVIADCLDVHFAAF